MEQNTTDLKSFTYLENGRINFSPLKVVKTNSSLDPGLYSLTVNNPYGPNPDIVLTAEKLDATHNLIKYYFIEAIENILEKFFDEQIRKQIKDMNFKNKVGICLYGKPGTSKTSILQYYQKKLIEENDCIVIYFSGKVLIEKLWEIIRNIRKVQSNTIVIYLDEFDEFFKSNNDWTELFKTIMDGHLSIDNCIFMATTNHFNMVPKAITERPSRIKYCFEVTHLEDPKLIEELIQSLVEKAGLKIETKDLVEASIGKTIDEIKEIVLDKLMDVGRSERTVKSKIGFQK